MNRLILQKCNCIFTVRAGYSYVILEGNVRSNLAPTVFWSWRRAPHCPWSWRLWSQWVTL